MPEGMVQACDIDSEWDGVTVGHSPREGISVLAALGWDGEGLGAAEGCGGR